jgi:hypothetical protein
VSVICTWNLKPYIIRLLSQRRFDFDVLLLCKKNPFSCISIFLGFSIGKQSCIHPPTLCDTLSIHYFCSKSFGALYVRCQYYYLGNMWPILFQKGRLNEAQKCKYHRNHNLVNLTFQKLLICSLTFFQSKFHHLTWRSSIIVSNSPK